MFSGKRGFLLTDALLSLLILSVLAGMLEGLVRVHARAISYEREQLWESADQYRLALQEIPECSCGKDTVP